MTANAEQPNFQEQGVNDQSGFQENNSFDETQIQDDLAVDKATAPNQFGSGITKQNNAMPKGIKIVLGGVAALFVVILSSVLMFSGDDERESASNENIITPEELMGNAENKQDELASMLGLPSDNTVENPVVNSNQDTSGIPAPQSMMAMESEQSVTNEMQAHDLNEGDSNKDVKMVDIIPEIDLIKEMLNEHAQGLTQLTQSLSVIEQKKLPSLSKQIEGIKDSA